jgi:hypothetical protein
MRRQTAGSGNTTRHFCLGDLPALLPINTQSRLALFLFHPHVYRSAKTSARAPADHKSGAIGIHNFDHSCTPIVAADR